MKSLGKSIIWISLLLFTHLQKGFSQIYLQLERPNNTKSLKFYEGDILEFQLKEYPSTWRISEILDIKPNENLLVLEDSFYTLDAFYSIRIRKPWAKTTGTKLMQFSGAWLLYGTVATLASSGVDNFEMSKADVLIGATFAAVGLFIRSVFQKKKFKLNNRRRLRIIDLRMTDY